MFSNKSNNIFNDLYEAIKNRDITKIKSIITDANNQKINLNATHPKHQVSPLHWAILKCNGKHQQQMIEIMELLYLAQVDVNLAANAKLQFTPLHSAARRALPEVVEWMMQHGANSNAQDGTGQTPLDYVNKSIVHQSQNDSDTYNRLIKVKGHLSNPPAPTPVPSNPCTIL